MAYEVDETEIVLDSTKLSVDAQNVAKYFVSLPAAPDFNAAPNISPVILQENGKPIMLLTDPKDPTKVVGGAAHTRPEQIASSGGRGRFSYWYDGSVTFMAFSATDNSNPATNGRRYSVKFWGDAGATGLVDKSLLQKQADGSYWTTQNFHTPSDKSIAPFFSELRILQDGVSLTPHALHADISNSANQGIFSHWAGTLRLRQFGAADIKSSSSVLTYQVRTKSQLRGVIPVSAMTPILSPQSILVGGSYTAYIPSLPINTPGDTVSQPTISRLRLFQNGRSLTPHVPSNEVATRHGSFQHVANDTRVGGATVVFSTLDRSNPLTSGDVISFEVVTEDDSLCFGALPTTTTSGGVTYNVKSIKDTFTFDDTNVKETVSGVGDGRTDNYKVMRAAAKYVSSNPNTILVFPEGIYNINQTRSPTSHVQDIAYSRVYQNPDGTYPTTRLPCSNFKVLGCNAKIVSNGHLTMLPDHPIGGSNIISDEGTVAPFSFSQCSNFTLAGFELDGRGDETIRNPGITIENIGSGVITVLSHDYIIRDMEVHHYMVDGYLIGDHSGKADYGIKIENDVGRNNGRQGMSIIHVGINMANPLAPPAGSFPSGSSFITDSKFLTTGMLEGGRFKGFWPLSSVDIEQDSPPATGFDGVSNSYIKFERTEFSGSVGAQILVPVQHYGHHITIANSVIKMPWFGQSARISPQVPDSLIFDVMRGQLINNKIDVGYGAAYTLHPNDSLPGNGDICSFSVNSVTGRYPGVGPHPGFIDNRNQTRGSDTTLTIPVYTDNAYTQSSSGGPKVY